MNFLKKGLLVSIFIASVLYSQVPTKDSVAKLYVATFNRAPDSAGLDYWVNKSGLSLEGIAKSFFEQPETKALYPDDYSEHEFVRQLYLNLFNREPDSKGWEYWENELKNHNIDRSTLILALINSALDDDAVILSNKAKVGEYFAEKGLNDPQKAKEVLINVSSSEDSVDNAISKIDNCVQNNSNSEYENNNSDYSQSNYQEESLPSNVIVAIDSNKSDLTQELKDSITYMYNEEKLAREIYMNLYKKYPLKQLYNISTKSEIKHEKAVNDLAIKYDLNITLYPDTDIPYDQKSLEEYGDGKYAVVEIQELYDMLYDKGIQSEKDALEVGCMVEVTDINDLNRYIAQALESNADDVLEVFNFLRDGSYRHYWAFDKGLKNIGVDDGCCSLGTDYCHPEYPNDHSSKGKGRRR